MKEEVKYVAQQNGSLLLPKIGAIYNETTLQEELNGSSCYDKWCTAHIFSRLKLLLTIVAIAACAAVIVVFLSNSINASKEVSGGQQEEIRDLKEKLEGQQTRLHRMQKELQFLVARQKSYEAREESEKRRQQLSNGSPTPRWTGDDRASELLSPPEFREDPVDVDQLPRGSPNKVRKNA